MKLRRRKLPFAAALTAAAALSPGYAAYAQPADTSGVRITQGGEGAAATSLVLPLGKAAIVDLPSEARDVLLSNPQIANAVVRTPRRVYVIGQKVGNTNAFFFDAHGGQIANLEIRVEPDIGPLNELLRRHAPNSRVTAEAVNGSVVLTGTVHSAAEADRALQIATRYIGAGEQSSNSSGGGGGGGDSSGGGGGGLAAMGAMLSANSGGGQQSGPQIINLIQVEGSEQVLVRVRVVEMSRTLVRQLGINLNYEEMINKLLPEDAFVSLAAENGFSIAGRLLGGLTGEGGVAENILNPKDLTYPGPNAGTGASPSLAGVGGYDEKLLTDSTGQPLLDGNGNPISYITQGPAQTETARRTDASIQAFERAGLLRVLAEPNLTAISGESARFLAGGEFPVPASQDKGVISIEFKPFGVGLSFTPIVLSGGRISLKMATEVSELTADGAINTGDTPIQNADGTTSIIRGISIPALQVRRAETTVEMPSGGSLMLAGLIQERTRHALEGIPGAMNMPVLGSLFRSRDFINNETELVILVTPYLVKPTSADQLHAPTDGFLNPTEAESLLTGRLNAIYRSPAADGEPDRRLRGPHGHVID
jgi:pilus assembly protein CpaC